MSTELTPSERAAYEWITQSLPKGYWAVMLFMAGMLIFSGSLSGRAIRGMR